MRKVTVCITRAEIVGFALAMWEAYSSQTLNPNASPFQFLRPSSPLKISTRTLIIGTAISFLEVAYGGKWKTAMNTQVFAQAKRGAEEIQPLKEA